MARLRMPIGFANSHITSFYSLGCRAFLCFPSARIKGVRSHAQLQLRIKLKKLRLRKKNCNQMQSYYRFVTPFNIDLKSYLTGMT